VKPAWHKLLRGCSCCCGIVPLAEPVSSNFSVFYALAFAPGPFPALHEMVAAAWHALGDGSMPGFLLSAQRLERFRSEKIKISTVQLRRLPLLIGLGNVSARAPRFIWLLGGGLLGAIFFYLITNSASWFFNPFQAPEYARTFYGWLKALTTGTQVGRKRGVLPQHIDKRGLFTALFAGAFKLTASEESAEEKEPTAHAPVESEPGEAPEAAAPAGEAGN